MTKDTTAALSVLREAVRNELDGQAMYLQAAAGTQDELGKSMFRSFAKEEEQHVHILQAQYATVNESGAWMDLEAAQKERRDPKLVLFPLDEQEVKELVPAGTSDLEALKIAMGFEKRAVAMYEQAADDTDDAAAQAFFRELAEWEGTHYRILDNSYDYLANEGEWYFQELEMPMYEG
jgi:bacterioferritin (cytochrome b1)